MPELRLISEAQASAEGMQFVRDAVDEYNMVTMNDRNYSPWPDMGVHNRYDARQNKRRSGGEPPPGRSSVTRCRLRVHVTAIRFRFRGVPSPGS